MRVVMISPDFSVSGGVGRHLDAVTRELAGRGVNVGVVHAAPLPPDAWPGSIETCAVHGVEQPTCARNAEALGFIERFGPDVVHVHGGSNFALEAELARRGRFIKTLHTLDFCPTGLKYHFLTARPCTHAAGWACLPRQAFKRCTLSKRPAVWWRQVRRAEGARVANQRCRTLVVTSSYSRAQAIEHGCDPARIVVLPYFTVPPEAPSPLPAEPRVLFAGRLFPEKGLDLVVRAVASLPSPVCLDVVGGGPAATGARRLAERLGIGDRVAFHGWQTDLDPYYRRATVLAVASRLAEPFGIVGIEAGAHARPVVAFDVGGVSDWLADGVNGWLVRPYDVGAMARRMGELVAEPATARRMGEAGRTSVMERFSADGHLTRLLDLYADPAHG